jgi:hypothetical protein
MVEWTVAIQQSTHQPALLPIGVFDAPLAFEKLDMLTGLSCTGGKKQRAAEALGAIAVGVPELVGGVHAQAF